MNPIGALIAKLSGTASRDAAPGPDGGSRFSDLLGELGGRPRAKGDAKEPSAEREAHATERVKLPAHVVAQAKVPATADLDRTDPAASDTKETRASKPPRKAEPAPPEAVATTPAPVLPLGGDTALVLPFDAKDMAPEPQASTGETRKTIAAISHTDGEAPRTVGTLPPRVTLPGMPLESEPAKQPAPVRIEAVAVKTHFAPVAAPLPTAETAPRAAAPAKPGPERAPERMAQAVGTAIEADPAAVGEMDGVTQDGTTRSRPAKERGSASRRDTRGDADAPASAPAPTHRETASAETSTMSAGSPAPSPESRAAPATAPVRSVALPVQPAEVKGPMRELSLKLDPAEHGPVTVRMRLSGSDLAVGLKAERDSTARLVERDRDDLADLLADEGYDATVTVVDRSVALAPPQAPAQSGSPPATQSAPAAPQGDGAALAGGDRRQAGRDQPPRSDSTRQDQGTRPNAPSGDPRSSGALYV